MQTYKEVQTHTHTHTHKTRLHKTRRHLEISFLFTVFNAH